MTTLFLGRICRTCLLESSTMHKLLDPQRRDGIQIEEMLLSAVPNFNLGSDMDNDVPLPVEICQGCLERLQVSYDFQQMCLQSNERLRHFFTHTEMKNEELSGLNHNCINVDNNQQEVFKIEVNDEIMTVNSYGDDEPRMDPVKEETSSATSSSAHEDDGMVKEEPNNCYNEVNKDCVDDITQGDCDFADIYSPSGDPGGILSPSDGKDKSERNTNPTTVSNKQKSSSAIRMRKLREKRKATDPNFTAKETKRLSELRKKKREQLSESELAAIRLKQREEKRCKEKKNVGMAKIKFKLPLLLLETNRLLLQSEPWPTQSLKL